MATKIILVNLLLFNLILVSKSLLHSPPRFVKQPPTDELLFQVKQSSGDVDKPFIIECEAEGEPAPKYRWIKNGKPFAWEAYDDRILQHQYRGTLVVTKPRDEDLGQYQCFAENEHGTATSNSVFVRKAELNSFKDQPVQLVEANEGEPFNLTCHPPDGWPKPNVYWLIQNSDGSIKSINNSRMTLDPEGNLWFAYVTKEDMSDNFKYACAATSVFRKEYKIGNGLWLKVISAGISAAQNKQEPVRQYVTRKNEVALRGKQVELFCIFGGIPLPQIVWYKDGIPIRASDRVSQENYGKSLKIKHVTFEDQGAYTCEASNGVGHAQSYSISLSVLSSPYFTREPEFVNAADDETVEIHCEAKGIPDPDIKWIHNGRPIAESPPNPRRKVSSNTIRIERLQANDTGNYGCNATNVHGYVYKDVYINVLSLPPEITEPPGHESTVDLRTVTLRCRAFGAPKPEVKWLHGGLELTGGRYNILENGDLEIRDVAFSDSGNYTCFAINKFGKQDASGSLTVKEHTKITDEPEDYEVSAGTPATFRCNAVSDSSLDLQINWLSNGLPIDFDAEPRFVRSSDYSLTITKTTELDSGTYTCVAKTELDEAVAHSTLTVQDVPNAPRLEKVDCGEHTAKIYWKPMGDNRSPILSYTIQGNTSFTPDTWDDLVLTVPATDMSYSVEISPWANYTFRVIARNKIGPSIPSQHSTVCITQPEVPHKNPDNVEGKGTEPNNLVISWTVMPQIEHNAPKFLYRVYWKKNIPGETWITEDVPNWRQNKLEIFDQPTFVEYRIKVVAMNEMGEADVTAKEVIGYSGEAEPLQAPTNFTLVNIHSSTTAMLQWNSVPPESVRGHFKGYKIQTWTDRDGEEAKREIQIKGDENRALVSKFVPHTKNYARVLVFNGRYNGPPSEVLYFTTPEGVPGPIPGIDAYQMGASALYLIWKKPQQPNGVLIGYRIYYRVVKGTLLESLIEREPYIKDPKQTRAKLAGLLPNSKYRIHVRALTRAGEGDDYYIETRTRVDKPAVPDKPSFTWTRLPSDTDNGLAKIKVTWLPSLGGNQVPGSHFFVKYKLKGKTLYEETHPQMKEDYIEVRGLSLGELYEFKVVAVDGDYMTESDPQDVDTYGIEGPIIQPKENVATAGWFIGMMLAIAFLLLVLIIVCIVKRNRGGKYAVHEREQANGRHDYPDEGGFHEYSQPLDNKSHGRTSMSSEPKQAPESDTDSMAEYGEGDTEGMNEDGSFIGQYGRQRKQGDNASQGFATLV
ncbi:neuroglian [Chrysoperla carnea]|uniref:neuroglian n=1 Tax=Chrysoperla carnea TaxID=189513 RepID=UPI001D06E9C4|nr:neuroglian [Chrysoperla carnea]